MPLRGVLSHGNNGFMSIEAKSTTSKDDKKMTAILDHIDQTMLAVAQKVSDVVDDVLGFDHWSIAQGFLRVGVGLILLSTAMSLAMSHTGPLAAFGFTVTTLFSFLWYYIYRGMADRLRMQRASRDAGRALRISELRTRRIDLAMTAFICAIQFPRLDMADVTFMGAILCFHVHYYFKAADLPPPSTSNKVAWGL